MLLLTRQRNLVFQEIYVLQGLKNSKRERHRELGLSSFENRELMGILSMYINFSYAKVKKTGTESSHWYPETEKESRDKLKYKKINYTMSEISFSLIWSNSEISFPGRLYLPGKYISLEILKIQLGKALALRKTD